MTGPACNCKGCQAHQSITTWERLATQRLQEINRLQGQLARASAPPPAEGSAEFQVREVAETIRNFTRRDKPPKPPGFTPGEWDHHCGLIASTAETFQSALIRGYDKWTAAAESALPVVHCPTYDPATDECRCMSVPCREGCND